MKNMFFNFLSFDIIEESTAIYLIYKFILRGEKNYEAY